ncbi:NAD(+) diphosphatase [Georgenia satyanarayanai]|uniref:NAD(+) diphosphatase n=1 Tax=Georgenia satyanarayanai TaxID=860221 RepID=UPI0012657726|nr:NAD(+) diphosphatase [Georgenia satyanarayanai]
MALTQLPLARTTVDADGASRARPGLLTELRADPGTRVVLVHRGLVGAGEDGLVLLPATDVPTDAWTVEQVHYLGREGGTRFVALVLPGHLGSERDLDGAPVDTDAPLVALLAGMEVRHLREIGDRLSDRDTGLGTTAVALAGWHERNPRCPRCGEATEVLEAGWVRRCVVDHSLHYPRTDAAVIMAVVDSEDRLLLGHAAHWPEHRFSTLAGYVEPGESLEAAVRREVAEETGVVVGAVRYEGSQPWPFPCSLMTAFRADVAPGAGTEIAVDGVELTEARFFTRGELTTAAADGTVILPSLSSIARSLIEDWYGGPLAAGPSRA